MKDQETDSRRRTPASAITLVLEGYGAEALKGLPPDEASREWLAAGFDDPEEVEDWLRARCFDARGARALDDAGVTPEQASARTTAGSADYEETVGFKLLRGDLSLEEARRIMTSAFWDS